MDKMARNEVSLRSIVEGRIEKLFLEAVNCAKERPADAKEYAKLACTIAKRHRIAIGKERKKKFCKKCGAVFILGQNLEIEKDGEWEIYICKCGGKRKFHV
jgi:RNase P subunit RPR2